MSVLDGWWDDFFFGLMTVLQVFSVSLVIAVVCGLLGASAKLSKSRILRGIAQGYTIVFRGAPELLVLLLFYFGMAIALTKLVQFVDPSVKFIDLPPFWAGSIAIGLIVGAYMTETFRGAFLGVDRGQIEAARALGLTPLETFIDVILPQSMRVALPALANNLASLVKDSSLAYAISVVELTMVGYRVQAESYQPIPVFITIASIYLILTTAFTTLTSALEAKLEVGQTR